MSEQQKQSGLPPLEQVREEQTMKMVTVLTSDFAGKFVETTMQYSNQEGTPPIPVQGYLFRLYDERINGFMPSKVWVHKTGDTMKQKVDLAVLFYVNSTLPPASRPFEKNSYLLYFFPHHTHTVEYDIGIRIFLDQVYVHEFKQMLYVVMFGEESYKQLIVEKQ